MSSTHNPNVLEIDLPGYRQTLQNKGKARILLEGWANAADTNTTVILVTFSQKDGWADLTVTDNDPDGFKKLKDAWTLFAASERREDVTLRGRFGQGEKELIAICCDGKDAYMTIRSTTGAVEFNATGRFEAPDDKTTAGTELHAHLKLNQKEAAEFRFLVGMIIPPAGTVFEFNGNVIERPAAVKVVTEALDTVYWDQEGQMHETTRKTLVEIFDPGFDKPAYIMELGVPVVDHPGRFHVNVLQKVPLNSARDNVKPSYLRKLNEVVYNATHELLSFDEMQTGWVKDALPNATREALLNYKDTVFGEDAVAFDPSNPEANKRALDEGRTLIPGRSFSRDTWARMKDEDLIKPAGQVIPVGIPTSADGVPPIDPSDWTDDMCKLAQYAAFIGEHLLGFQPNVEFYNQVLAGPHARAFFGGQTITFNLRYLGKRWPAEASQLEVDNLLLHEFAHHNTGTDHFTDQYINALSRLGAKLRNAKPQLRAVQ
jgi:hypothetical protein